MISRIGLRVFDAEVEAETQDQDQEQVQEMDRLELLILVVELVAHPEVLQEQILLKKVIMVVKE